MTSVEENFDITLNKVFYVYVHTFNNGKRYIGKGKDSRCYDFRNRSQYWKNVYKKYGDPKIDIVLSNLTEADALELEEFLIAESLDSGMVLGSSLINLTQGGEGTSGHKHNEATKKLISEASKIAWKDNTYRENIISKMKEYSSREKTKKLLSERLKSMWENEEYRSSMKKVTAKMWQSKEYANKMKQRMAGKNNPSARIANIYDYKTDEVIATNVVSAVWARENGCSRSKLQVTAKADRSLPSSKENPHHHKGVYMRYTDGK